MLFLENYAKIKINISAFSGKSSPMGTFRDNGELLGLCFLFVSSGKKTFNISFGQGSRIEGSRIMFPLKYQEVIAYKSKKILVPMKLVTNFLGKFYNTNMFVATLA